MSVCFSYQFIMGDGFLTVFKIYHAFNDCSLFSGKWGAVVPDEGVTSALYYCKIFAVYFPVFSHGRKDASADKVFGDHSESGGIAVKTVATAKDKRFVLLLVVPCKCMAREL